MPVSRRAFGGAVGLVLELLAPALAVAGGVDHDPLAVDRAALGGPVADELDRVDRLAAAADQAADVLPVDRARDLRLVLGDVDRRVELERVDRPARGSP